MKPDKNKDITEHMVDVLRKHSLPYKEGAWERFKDFEASKRKKVVLWPYFTGAAAVILLAFTLFMNRGEDISTLPTVVNTAKSDASANKDVSSEIQRTEKNTQREGSITQSTITPTVKSSRKLIAKNNIVSKSQLVVTNTTLNKSVNNNNDEINNLVTVSTTNAPTAISPSKEGSALVDSKPSGAESLAHQPSGVQSLAAKKPVDKVQKDEIVSPDKKFFDNQAFAYSESLEEDKKLSVNSLNKWNFSIEVSPNIKDNNVNFGGGVGVAYNLNKRLSISSGISYVQLDAHRGPNQVDIPQEFSKTSLNSYNYGKTLNEVNTSLVGLDIPINLKLNINSNMYASAGVSVFNVLSESRYNNFEEHVPELSFNSVASSSQKMPDPPVIHTVYSKETSESTPYRGKNFTGFFNLSVGYKLPFLQNLNLAVEPYLKLPIGSLSNQDMDLSNGGLKIITSF